MQNVLHAMNKQLQPLIQPEDWVITAEVNNVGLHFNAVNYFLCFLFVFC